MTRSTLRVPANVNALHIRNYVLEIATKEQVQIANITFEPDWRAPGKQHDAIEWKPTYPNGDPADHLAITFFDCENATIATLIFDCFAIERSSDDFSLSEFMDLQTDECDNITMTKVQFRKSKARKISFEEVDLESGAKSTTTDQASKTLQMPLPSPQQVKSQKIYQSLYDDKPIQYPLEYETYITVLRSRYPDSDTPRHITHTPPTNTPPSTEQNRNKSSLHSIPRKTSSASSGSTAVHSPPSSQFKTDDADNPFAELAAALESSTPRIAYKHPALVAKYENSEYNIFMHEKLVRDDWDEKHISGCYIHEGFPRQNSFISLRLLAKTLLDHHRGDIKHIFFGPPVHPMYPDTVSFLEATLDNTLRLSTSMKCSKVFNRKRRRSPP